MPWKPINEAHAIDKVRILVAFTSPLPSKSLARATSPVVDQAQSFGLDEIERVSSSQREILINGDQSVSLPQEKNGWVLKRNSDGGLKEEVGFRDAIFGYYTTEYGRWENFKTRFWELVEGPLGEALDSIDIKKITLEYWDRFIFEGPPNDADATQLLEGLDPSLPKEVVEGQSTWHSRAGWFEYHNNCTVLVNRNLNTADEEMDSEEKRRVINIDLRPNFPPVRG